MVLRPLTTTDAEAYQALRLRSLREHPEAFALALEEEQQTSLETVARRLERSSTERYILGAFEGENLIGILSFRRWEGLKIRHRASIGGMYVPPKLRGRGVGETLLEGAIDRARALIAAIPHAGPDSGAFLSVKPRIPISRRLQRVPSALP